MMYRELKKQLNSLKPANGRINPDRAWVVKNREIMLAQIRNTVEEEMRAPRVNLRRVARSVLQAAKIFIPDRIVVMSRAMSLTMVIAFVAVSGWIATVSASYDSLPGEVLYHVKIATEKTELIFASVAGEESKVETLLRHASNRVDEYQKSKTPDQASIAIESLKKSIASTNESLEQIGGETGETAVAVAKVVNERTEQLLLSIDQVTEGNAKELNEATNLIEATGVRAVEVLVEQNLAGDSGIGLDEVKATVEKKLERLVTGLSEINKDVASSTLLASTTAPLAVVSSTVDMSQITSTTAGVSVGVQDVQTFIDQNDLLSAIKKVQTLTEAKNDAGIAVIEAKIATDALIQSTATTTPQGGAAPVATTSSPAVEMPEKAGS